MKHIHFQRFWIRKELLVIVLLVIFTMSSCSKPKDDAVTAVVLNPAVTTNGIIAPAGFVWANSRNINFTVTLTDTGFQAMAHLISIYDGDPLAGGNLLVKGSATILSSFKSTIYLSNQILLVYIVETAPDNSKVTQKVTVGTVNVSTSIQ